MSELPVNIQTYLSITTGQDSYSCFLYKTISYCKYYIYISFIVLDFIRGYAKVIINWKLCNSEDSLSQFPSTISQCQSLINSKTILGSLSQKIDPAQIVSQKYITRFLTSCCQACPVLIRLHKTNPSLWPESPSPISLSIHFDKVLFNPWPHTGHQVGKEGFLCLILRAFVNRSQRRVQGSPSPLLHCKRHLSLVCLNSYLTYEKNFLNSSRDFFI